MQSRRAFTIGLTLALAPGLVRAEPSPVALPPDVEAFMLGTWRYTVPDVIGTRTLSARFERLRRAYLTVEGDSDSLPMPLTGHALWRADRGGDTFFYLTIEADATIGGGVHRMTFIDIATLRQDSTGAIWSRIAPATPAP